MAERPLVCIVGPTAAGKSALALELARAARAEIVSCDSLQVYRGLDVGSAKPTPAERAQVPHHLLDVADPDEIFSAARWAELARAALEDVARRGRPALVVGGTGLYLRALLSGLFAGPPRNEALRRRLEALARRFGDAQLHRLLRRVDPEAAARLVPRDRVRVVRALEVFRSTGRPIGEHFRRGTRALEGYAVLTVGLAPTRTELRRRVEARVDEMLERGLLDEVRALLRRGYAPSLRPLQAIGYRQALEVIAGRSSLAAARHDIVQSSMRYAKRQMTWFRHQARVLWHAEAAAAAAAVRAFWSAHGVRS